MLKCKGLGRLGLGTRVVLSVQSSFIFDSSSFNAFWASKGEKNRS
jgi:hypothetical protein